MKLYNNMVDFFFCIISTSSGLKNTTLCVRDTILLVIINYFLIIVLLVYMIEVRISETPLSPAITFAQTEESTSGCVEGGRK